MKVYEIIADLDAFRWLDNDILIDFKGLDGTIVENWSIIELNCKEKENPLGDFTSMSGLGTCVNKRAKEIMEKEIEGLQFLPVKAGDCGDFSLLNVTKMLDAIDYDKALPRQFDSGKIFMFEQYAFKKQVLENVYLFKIPELSHQTYATNTFKEFVDKHQLTGLIFDELWFSDC